MEAKIECSVTSLLVARPNNSSWNLGGLNTGSLKRWHNIEWLMDYGAVREAIDA